MNFKKEVKDLYTKKYDINKRIKKTQINGGIYRVHGLEELMMLTCPYYPKQSIV